VVSTSSDLTSVLVGGFITRNVSKAGDAQCSGPLATHLSDRRCWPRPAVRLTYKGRPTVRVSQLDYADRQVKGQPLGITHYKFVMTFSLRSLGRNYRPGLQVSDAVCLSFRPPT
jgi:hypothetical protein